LPAIRGTVTLTKARGLSLVVRVTVPLEALVRRQHAHGLAVFVELDDTMFNQYC